VPDAEKNRERGKGRKTAARDGENAEPFKKRNTKKEEPYPSREKTARHAQEDKKDKTGKDKAKGRSGAARPSASPGEMRLNQYIAHAGICSRREADKLIPTGIFKVNGLVITEMGYKVKPGDKVTMEDRRLNAETKQYVVLNKPKAYLTTMDDPQERKTVMELVKGACNERIYPVGRLDRNTTGVLLLTNDGELATQLTHPRHNVKKVYHVYLDKNLSRAHLEEIAAGITLEDGPVKVDAIAWVVGQDDKKQVGVELHSGRNRIVRRIFEQLGYDVIKLDRVMFAGITKKDIPRGKWRHLTQTEVNILKRIR
jgi:23S rRNA pseudouridine2605 synthase